MKKVILILATAFFTFAFIGCSKQQNSKEYVTINGSYKTIAIENPKPLIPIGETNFKKMVSYIEDIEKSGVIFHLIIFFDKDGNSYQMRLLKRSNFYKGVKPSEDYVICIDGIFLYKNIKDKKHAILFDITKERAFPYLIPDGNVEKHIQTIEKGCGEFLESLARI